MKRFLLILLCMALLGSLFIPALGEAIIPRKLYVRVPSSWDTVYLCTGREKAEAIGPQTGREMAFKNDHYCLSIPDNLTEFTLSNGNTKVSSPIIAAPDHDLYVTVDAEGTAKVNYNGFEENSARTKQTEREYCLVGYINGRDYGFGGDYKNIGEYIFVNGTLTATFSGDTYVIVKTTDNMHWFLANAYCTDTSVILYESNMDEKMFVPANVEVTFTLKELDPKRVSLSYQINDKSAALTEPTTEAITPEKPEEPEKPEDPPKNEESVPTRSLTIVPPETWGNIHIYTWEPEEYGGFPGIPVKKEDGICTTNIKTTLTNLNISGFVNGKMVKTDDIKLVDNGKDVTIKVAKNKTYEVYYPGDIIPRRAAASNVTGKKSPYRVSGDTNFLGNWDTKSDLGIMTEINSETFRKNFDNLPAGKYEIKIYKDGSNGESYGDSEGNNFFFVLDGMSTVTIDFSLKGKKASIDAYGPGMLGNSNTVNSSSSGVTDITEPAETTAPVTEPDVTKPDVTEPVTTVPDVTKPAVTDPVISNPAATEPDSTTIPANTSAATQPVTTPPKDGPDTMLDNQPFGGMMLFLFGVIAAFIYLVYLLIKNGSVSGEVTPEGKVLQRARLSKKDVESAVKENMPAPSDKLDQSVMEAIRKANEEHPTDS